MLKQLIEQLNANIVKVSYTHEDKAPRESMLISEDFQKTSDPKQCFRNSISFIEFLYEGKTVLTQTNEMLESKDVFRYVIDGEPQIKKKQTANGEVSFIANMEEKLDYYSFSGTLEFKVGEDELLLGLGQYEDGIFDYRNHTEYLYESNMRIAIPILMTTGHYAILIDTESNLVFHSEGRSVRFEIDTTNQLTYYVLLGKDIPELVSHLQELTGRAAMLPRWVFGYIQSKERYHTTEELLDTVDNFRRRGIPIDCIVQDWYSWKEGLWGEKKFDPDRYPNVKALVEKLHSMNAKFMVSVWPNMNPESENYREFKEKGLLLDNSNVYNAFNEKATELYWKQCEEEIMSAGSDALWCDNAEPFSDADWYGEIKREEALRYQLVVDTSKKSMPWEKINSYGLYHARGIYYNWKRTIPDKRVVNLTRSSYVSGQKYGCITWSGDICAGYETMRRQITEGLKMGLCGNPYWTLDIGGFFVVDDQYENRGCESSNNTNPLWFWKGDYNEGVKDLGYRELYTRWLQFGTFLPIFRSHGTDTPREPWNFGEEGDMFYDTIVKYIRLRYRLLPYIYSLAAAAHREASIMMRSLLFDFPDDRTVRNITDEFLFGDAFLVAPVLKAMYYNPGSCPITHADYVRQVYLPAGVKWYDYWTNQVYEGGQYIICEAPIERMPLFVRAGSIIPLSADVSYSDEKKGAVCALLVYEGADGTYTLYHDAGDNYNYEKGEYCCVEIVYCDSTKEVSIKKIDGDMEWETNFQITVITEKQF